LYDIANACLAPSHLAVAVARMPPKKAPRKRRSSTLDRPATGIATPPPSASTAATAVAAAAMARMAPPKPPEPEPDRLPGRKPVRSRKPTAKKQASAPEPRIEAVPATPSQRIRLSNPQRTPRIRLTDPKPPPQRLPVVDSQDLLARLSIPFERLPSVFYSSMEPPQPPPLTSSVVSSTSSIQAQRDLLELACPDRNFDNVSDEKIKSITTEEWQALHSRAYENEPTIPSTPSYRSRSSSAMPVKALWPSQRSSTQSYLEENQQPPRMPSFDDSSLFVGMDGQPDRLWTQSRRDRIDRFDSNKGSLDIDISQSVETQRSQSRSSQYTRRRPASIAPSSTSSTVVAGASASAPDEGDEKSSGFRIDQINQI